MSETRRGRPPTRRQNLFTKDLKSMMYAFGDEDSTGDSITVMEDILIDYITELCMQAGRVAGARQKVKVDDFKFVLRNDAKKLGRVEELLSMQKEIQQSRKLFDEAAEK